MWGALPGPRAAQPVFRDDAIQRLSRCVRDNTYIRSFIDPMSRVLAYPREIGPFLLSGPGHCHDRGPWRSRFRDRGLHIVKRAVPVLSRIVPGDSGCCDEFVSPEGDDTPRGQLAAKATRPSYR